jgi:hypothetical protein
MAAEEDILASLARLKADARRKPVQDREFEVEEDNTKEFIGAMGALGEIEVLVGIPQEKTARDEGKIGNAALGYIHEFGSPINNIPARPFLYPGIKNSVREWQPKLAAAAEAALKGDSAAMLTQLDEAGLIASGAVKQTILAGIPPPVSRRRRGSRPAMGPGEAIPLVDTGQLLRSITWVVKK